MRKEIGKRKWEMTRCKKREEKLGCETERHERRKVRSIV